MRRCASNSVVSLSRMTPSKSKITAIGPDMTSVREQQPRGAFDSILVRQVERFERRRVRDGRVERADDAHRRVEPFEGLFLNLRGEAFTNPAGARVLVDDQNFVTMSGDGEERLAIERHEAAKIDDARLHAVVCEPVRHAHPDVDVCAVGYNCEIVTRPAQGGATDRDRFGPRVAKSLLDAGI